MKRSLTMFFVLVAVTGIGYSHIMILHPAEGQEIPRNSESYIGWNWTEWGFGGTTPTFVNLALYKGGTSPANKLGNIAQNLPIGRPGHGGGGGFPWKAGKYDGGIAPVGNDYYIEALVDGIYRRIMMNPFSLAAPVMTFPAGAFNRYVELNPDPGCPMCGSFDINELLARLGNPADIIGNLVILRNGRQVGLLGKLGQGGLLMNRMAKLRFGADDFVLLGQANQGFEVAIIGDSGNILRRAPISLRMRR